MKKLFQQNKKGFTLLFAVIVSMLVLTIGASIISIGLKQITLSSVGRESQYAFYVANSGAECALYWDTQVGSDGNDGDFFYYIPVQGDTSEDLGVTESPMTCFGEIGDLGVDLVGQRSERISINNGFRTDFASVNVPTSDDKVYCLSLSVEKYYEGGVLKTTMNSRGYNYPCADLPTNPRAVERGLQVFY